MMRKYFIALMILLVSSAAQAATKRIYEYTTLAAPADDDQLLIADDSDSDREYKILLSGLFTYMSGKWTAADIPIVDSGNLLVAEDVEAAIAEVIGFIPDLASPGTIGGTTPGVVNATTIAAGAGGFGVDADGDVTAKSVTIVKVDGVAGDLGLSEANSNDTHGAGWRGPASIVGDGAYRGQFANAGPTGTMLQLWGASTSGTGTAADPYIHPTSFVSVPLGGLLDNSITDPADADDMIYIRTQKALTLSDIYCVAQGGGSITLTLQECDNATCASPSTIEGAITCDADGAEDDGTLTDGAIAAGAWIKVLFSAPTGTVNSLAWSVDGVQTW